MSPASPHLRPGTLADLDALLTLERSIANAPHWPPQTYAAILNPTPKAPQRCLILAHAAAELIGFAVGSLPAPNPERTAELETIAVAANARRAGIGRALCLAVIDWCRTCGAAAVDLEVRASSQPAIALYSSLGFHTTGLRPRYYLDPQENALLMRLQLE